jgi:hypothetical protein
MFLRGKNRIGAAVLAAALAMALAAPAGAAGWDGFRGAWELTGGFLPRVLGWLGLSPVSSAVLKCDQGLSIDPNGCPKASGALPGPIPGAVSKCDQGLTIDPNGGCSKARGGLRPDGGRRDVPVHRR